MCKKGIFLLAIWIIIGHSFIFAEEDKGVRPQFKIVIGEDRSVKVFDMQGNPVADKPGNTALSNKKGPEKPQLHNMYYKHYDSAELAEEKQKCAAKAPDKVNTEINSTGILQSRDFAAGPAVKVKPSAKKNITLPASMSFPSPKQLQYQKDFKGGIRIKDAAATPNLLIYTGANNTCTYNSTTHMLVYNTSVGNTGDGNAGAFRVGWYLSPDITIETGDKLLMYAPVSYLDAGYYVNTSDSIDLDAVSGLDPGTYYPGVIIDYLGQVSESDETDNTGYWGIPVDWLLGDPNLKLFSGTGADNSYSYNTSTHLLLLHCSVENNGPVSAGAFKVGWYLSDNTTISTIDFFLTSYPVSSLASGEYVNTSRYKDLDDFSCSVLPGGTYYVGLLMDYQNTVIESDESDNESYFTTPVTWNCGKPNLTEYTGPGSNNSYSYSTSHHRLNLSLSIQNNGDARAGSFRVGWYVSGNTVISTGDYFVDSYIVSNLPKGENITTTASKDLDGFCGGENRIPAGEYYVGVIIDDLFKIDEFDENDNRYYFTPTINYIGCGPNLKLFTGSGSKNIFSYDDTSHVITFYNSVENNGNDEAGEFRLGWYLSADDSITTSDYLITTGYVGGLAVDAFVTKSNSKNLDDFCETGDPIPVNTYYAGLIIDYRQEVTEGFESDNTYYWPTPQVTFGCPSTDLHKISGRVKFGIDSTIAINQVRVDLSGDSIRTTNTNASGFYEFVNMPAGICSVAVSKARNSSPEACISAFDASHILRYYVNKITLSEVQKIAADASGDGTISSYDASVVLRYNVGQDVSSFGVGKWKFIVPPLTDWLNPITMRCYEPLGNDQINQNFDGILVGDVSGNYPGSMLSKTGNGQVVAGEMKSLNGNKLELPVRMEGVSAYNAVGFELKFDKEQLQVQNVSLVKEKENILLAFHELNGTLRVAIAGANEIKETDLLNITFKKKTTIDKNDIKIMLMNYEIDGKRVDSPQQWMVAVNERPEQFDLEQNFPNPFNPSTKISYSVAEKSEVKMVIYNTLGQNVRILLNASQNAGKYIVSWDGRDGYGKETPSGIYLVRLQADDFNKTIKIIKTK